MDTPEPRRAAKLDTANERKRNKRMLLVLLKHRDRPFPTEPGRFKQAFHPPSSWTSPSMPATAKS